MGEGLIKKRVARVGKGKSGGYRTIIVYLSGAKVVFVFGFAKSAKANLNATELNDYQKLARIFLSLSDEDIEKALSARELEEVNYDDEEVSE